MKQSVDARRMRLRGSRSRASHDAASVPCTHNPRSPIEIDFVDTLSLVHDASVLVLVTGAGHNAMLAASVPPRRSRAPAGQPIHARVPARHQPRLVAITPSGCTPASACALLWRAHPVASVAGHFPPPSSSFLPVYTHLPDARSAYMPNDRCSSRCSSSARRP